MTRDGGKQKQMRLAVLSNEKLNPWVNWTTLGPPLLHPLSTYEGAELISPPRLTGSAAREWLALSRRLNSKDTVFWMQGASRPEIPVHLASLLAGRARRSAFVVDAWRYLLPKIGTLAVLQGLNPCFVAFREAYLELSARFPRGSFQWLPFGVDTTVFNATPRPRPIFAYWMGRRYEPLHRAMIRYCAARKLTYVYTTRGGEIADPHELGRLVGSSEYFLVAPPNLANPERTGGYSPFVMRYLEGLAAGTRLLGTLPASGEYQLLLPRDAILEVASDGSDLADKLDADRADPIVWKAVDRASALVRDRHSWSRRAEQVFCYLKSGTVPDFSFDKSNSSLHTDMWRYTY